MPQAQTLQSLQSACCFIPSLSTPWNPCAAEAAAPEELRTGCPAEGPGMLQRVRAGQGGSWRLPWQDRLLPPSSCTSKVSSMGHSCSQPLVLCRSLVLFLPSLTHAPAPDRAGVARCQDLCRDSWGCIWRSRLAGLGPCWKRGQPLIHVVLAVLFLLLLDLLLFSSLQWVFFVWLACFFSSFL